MLDSEGWFRSCDIGCLDEDGFLYIKDRKKDIVIRGGENIACLEVEAAITEHPAVLEASVFGVPDARLGEKLATVISHREDQELTEVELSGFLAEKLAKFKIPEFQDQRGSFHKLFNFKDFLNLGIQFEPKEHFHSISKKNVIRGMHFQTNESSHNKIIHCIKGSIVDVCVDIRRSSPFYNQPVSIKLIFHFIVHPTGSVELVSGSFPSIKLSMASSKYFLLTLFSFS